MIPSLSVLVHGDTKVGKTTLLATAPRPLLFDADGKAQFLPRSDFLASQFGHACRVTWWDPLREPPPQWDGSFDVCAVRTSSAQHLQLAYMHLTQSPHQFMSVGLDSISEIQRLAKEGGFGREQMRIQDWGTLLTDMSFVVRDFRNLRDHPLHPIPMTVLSAESRTFEGKAQPYMQGQISVSMPYWLDLVGYLMMDRALDANNQPTLSVRRLQIAPDVRWIAGDNVGGLPAYLDNPNLTSLYLQVYPHLAAQPQEG